MRKKRKMDEQYLWAELKGNEAEIKEHLEEKNKVKKPFFYQHRITVVKE